MQLTDIQATDAIIQNTVITWAVEDIQFDEHFLKQTYHLTDLEIKFLYSIYSYHKSKEQNHKIMMLTAIAARLMRGGATQEYATDLAFNLYNKITVKVLKGDHL